MSKTQECLDYIAKMGSARSDQIATACRIEATVVSALLQPRVDSGALVACLVINPSTSRRVNEYRHSVAGAGAVQGKTDNSILFSKPSLPPRELRAPAPATPPPAEPETDARIGPVQDAVPVPPRNNGGRIRAALTEMKAGQSRVFEYSKWGVREAARIAGIEIVMRAEPGGGYRVWREA